LFTACLLACHCSFAQTYTGDEAEIEKILANVAQFSKYVMAGDQESIAAAYTADGKIFPNTIDIIEGTEGLAKYWTRSEGYETTFHKITPREIKIIGDEAYDYGYYEGKSKGPDGVEKSWRGKYVIVWKKVADDWKIYLDIWNSIRD
ncbi:MAG: DUF4440 domain-containing protein, partial [Bacteroidota bacterium]